ncbi:hypothetical protein FOCC_FOCC006801 [Frankliniella occidentalis]|nr:hypothetical protein FOCC_FOCC006801 [Frankliniella occidentalis]
MTHNKAKKLYIKVNNNRIKFLVRLNGLARDGVVVIKPKHIVDVGGGGDDLGSTDEVKVFKDEGEDEKRSENLTEEKSSLIDLTESENLSSDTV